MHTAVPFAFKTSAPMFQKEEREAGIVLCTIPVFHHNLVDGMTPHKGVLFTFPMLFGDSFQCPLRVLCSVLMLLGDEYLETD